MTSLPPDALRPDILFSSLENARGILAAVSGGPDSTALMHLLARWHPVGPRPPVAVATIDHGLRAEAAEEAALVARTAQALGLPHATLAWTGPKPATGMQEAAREARYRLLVQEARARGFSHLLTAHTLDDQAETVLMRLARGSGLAGLAGMRAERELAGLRHVRPLLGWPKATLVDLCRREGWAFVMDPSNRDERFARARWRRLMPLLAAEGLTARHLAAFAARARRAEEALDAKARDALARAAPVRGEDGLAFEGSVLAEEPFEIAWRVLAEAIVAAGLSLENSRLRRLEACTERLRRALAGGEGLGLTVAGALVRLDRRGRIQVGAEPPRRRGRPALS